jgi:hypothetical protein
MIELLSSTAYLIVNKNLSKKVGLQAAALLADLISKQVYFKGEEYFFNTEANIERDTTLSPYQQRACIGKLKALGLITVKRKGIPAKRYFKVHAVQVMQFLNNSEQKNCTAINNNKVINNNNNITIREQKFLNAVSLLDYDINLKKEFTDYWTEKNASGKKMKWELCQTWDTNLRLKTWAKRAKQWDKPLSLKTANSKIDTQLNEYNKGKEYL